MSRVIFGKQRGRILRTLIPLLIGVGSSSLLNAQSGFRVDSQLVVHVGDSFEYGMVGQMNIRQDEYKTEQEMAVLMVMNVDSISADQIDWNLSMAMMVPGEKNKNQLSTEVQPAPITMYMLTNRQGIIKEYRMREDSGGESGSDIFQPMMRNDDGGQLGPGWFLPVDLIGKTVGESWNRSVLDTAFSRFEGSETISTIMEGSTAFVFDGIVDTMGTKAVRLLWRGTGKMRGLQGPMVEVNCGTVYYSLEDHLMLALNSDMRLSTVDASKLNDDTSMGNSATAERDDENEAVSERSFDMDMHVEISRED